MSEKWVTRGFCKSVVFSLLLKIECAWEFKSQVPPMPGRRYWLKTTLKIGQLSKKLDKNDKLPNQTPRAEKFISI